MGRVSDALYFLTKWNGLFSPVQMINRCVLTWDQRIKYSPKNLYIPLLALLSVALRNTKMPTEDLLKFLLVRDEGDIDFRSLFKKIQVVKPRVQEINSLLDSFFKTGQFSVKALKWPSWDQRGIVLFHPLATIKERLIEKILSYQDKFHGNPYHVTCLSERPILDKFYKNLLNVAGVKLLTVEPLIPSYVQVRDFFSFTFFKSLKDSLYEMVQRVTSDNGMENFGYYFSKEQLEQLSLEELLYIIEKLTSVENSLDMYRIDDKDRRRSHTVSLSSLAKLAPKGVKEPILVDTSPLGSPWGDMPYES